MVSNNCVGSVLFILSFVPSCPYPLYPHEYTSPFAFSATKWLDPPTTFGCVWPCVPFTFTLTAAHISFSSLWIFIYVLPIPFAVTTPSSDTSATLVSNEVYLYVPPSIEYFIKLNPIVISYVIFSSFCPISL